MVPNFETLLECPFCGEEKAVLSLLSGNTFGGQQWSDLKSIYPMLPRVSPIQRCSACGKYYFEKEAKRRSGKDYSFNKGNLTYEQLKEAATQFGENLTEENRAILNRFLVWAYNDNYNREGSADTEVPDEEKRYIDAVLDELIASDGIDDIVRAEYCRERGLFEKSLALLDKCHPEEEHLVRIIEKMRVHAKEGSIIAFRL